MKKRFVDLTFSVTEGNMIHDALRDVGECALMRRFPHTWTFPVEDESLYNAVWEGDTSMSLDTEECRTIANALFARSCAQYDAGYETIGDELVSLRHKINCAAYSVRMANLAASCARSAGKEEAGDVPTRNPSPEAAPDEEPETLVSVRDASGVVREVTLDEAEEMREAAQGIYEGAPPEPQILLEDRTDLYFDFLEHGKVRPDVNKAKAVATEKALLFANALAETVFV